MEKAVIFGVVFAVSFFIFLSALISSIYKVKETSETKTRNLFKTVLHSTGLLLINIVSLLSGGPDKDISSATTHRQRKGFIILTIISGIIAVLCAANLYYINSQPIN